MGGLVRTSGVAQSIFVIGAHRTLNARPGNLVDIIAMPELRCAQISGGTQPKAANNGQLSLHRFCRCSTIIGYNVQHCFRSIRPDLLFVAARDLVGS